MPELSTMVSSHIFYRKMGNGPVVILVHGFPLSGKIWEEIWEDLSHVFTLIIPDLPGSGNSVLDKQTSISEMAYCIASIMDAEGINLAVIAGHSMGGYVGFEFAARYPERLAGLSLVHSTPLADDEDKKIARQKSIELIRTGQKNSFINQMIPNLFSTSFKQNNPSIIEEQVAIALAMDDTAMINFCNAMMIRNDNTYTLGDARFPVQWILGMEDNIIAYRKILQQCHKSYVNFVSFYDNCGHMSMMEAPEQLIAGLKEFTDYCYEFCEKR